MNAPETREQMDRPVVGIVGGICSGKTTVARMLAERGYERIDADRIGHEVLERADIKRRLKDEFGQNVFRADGSIDHAELARRALREHASTERLNSIVHPPILERIERQIRRADGPVALDAALLMEKGLHRHYCDVLIFVDAPREERLRRARQERSWDPEELERRENAQLPLERKKMESDYVVHNDGSKRELKHQINQLTGKIQKTLDPHFSAENQSR